MSRVDDTGEKVFRGRGRKDRRKWCKGKVGVVHQTEIRLGDKYTYAMKVCQMWQPSKRWGRWICVEQEVCSRCGKILRHSLGPACTMRPTP